MSHPDVGPLRYAGTETRGVFFVGYWGTYVLAVLGGIAPLLAIVLTLSTTGTTASSLVVFHVGAWLYALMFFAAISRSVVLLTEDRIRPMWVTESSIPLHDVSEVRADSGGKSVVAVRTDGHETPLLRLPSTGAAANPTYARQAARQIESALRAT